ncbi:putative D-/L-hydantoinase subunit A [Colletotrichum sp. SAR11_239]|nr:putative D-/L-hydantoinase subunit A [Colletotrichum sp. SAR11_239]
MSLYRIGVDVGGTNTDAAILDITAPNTPGRGVLASHKASTTPDITSGIESAIREVLTASAVDQKRVLSVTIGTTHFINALVEADTRRLSRVAVVRLCGPFTRQIPPFSDFPSSLRRILDGGVYYLDGGLEIDGREIAPLDHEQIRNAAREIVAAGVQAVALVGVFAPLDHAGVHEEACKKMFLEEAPGLDVVCSHDIGPPGLLERENATILNAAILRTAQKVTRGFKRAMTRLRLACPLYLSQNDGTLIDADTAAEYPIKTFASGPTNSMTGAAFLAGLDKVKTMTTDPSDASVADFVEPQVLVVDIGGTTTDVCALLPSGFPRQAPGFVEVGGVRTAFSMPEVVSIGLGGGSKVGGHPTSGDVTVGPGSVGHFLTQQSRVFGGSTLTATDVIVASGKAQLGDAGLIKDVPAETIEKARRRIKTMLEGVIEQMKVSAAPVHVLLVGGGALLVTEDLDGVEKCIQPIHQGAANAVGAAIGKISGEVDVIEILEGRDEKAVVTATCQKAIDIAVQKGAAADDVRIVEVNKMPLQYVDNGAMRIQVRAVGKLCVPGNPVFPPESGDTALEEEQDDEAVKESVSDALSPTTKPSLHVDLETYRPNVEDGVWYVSEVDLELISTGCGVLGTGGGGPTHHEFLKSLQALRTSEKGKMRIISPKALKDEDMVCFGSWYGTPSVINERIAGGTEIPSGIDAVTKILGIKSLDGIFIDEIVSGGGNGLSIFPTSVHYDIPVVDGDAMGRAYPTMYQGDHPECFDVCAGKLLFTGKIIDVRRYVGGGYTMGSVLLAPLADEERESDARGPSNADRHMLIPFQNEYLYAALTDSEGSEKDQEVICTVPDLISILGQDGEAIGSQDLRYGLRVNVIGLPAHPLWKTDKGMPVGGPKAFGLEMPFVGVGEYTEPRSVIEEFAA